MVLKAGSVAVGLVLLAAVAQAQTPDDVSRAIEQNNRIQQEYNERLRREQQERQSQPSSAGSTAWGVPSPAPAPAASSNDASCQNVTEIAFTGVTQLGSREQEKLKAPFIGRCLRLSDINALLAALTNAYVVEGLVTTRAYIAPQDMSAGRLEVLVVEGRVDKLLLEDGRGNNSVSLATAFPGVQGGLLSLRDLEQGLDQLNRLGSNKATLDIRPGAAPGSSTVVIHNEPDRLGSLGLSVDNHGSESTGIHQLGVNSAFYNLLLLNDLITASQNRSYPYADPVIGQTANAASIALPYGYYTFTLAYNDAEYQSLVRGTAGAFETSGTTRQASLRLDRVVYRGLTGRATLALGLTSKASRNYILDELITASSRNLTVVDVSGSFITGFLGGGLTLELALARGIKQLDAEKDPVGLPDTVPHAQFRRLNYGLSWVRPFMLSGHSFSFSSQWQGQYGFDALFGTEQISVGSFYSVRGFRNSSLAGDRGVYARNDLSLNLPLSGTWGNALLRPFIGCDVGNVMERNGSPGGTLAGMAVGTSVGIGNASIELVNARPLHVPESVQRDQHYTFVRASYSL